MAWRHRRSADSATSSAREAGSGGEPAVWGGARSDEGLDILQSTPTVLGVGSAEDQAAVPVTGVHHRSTEIRGPEPGAPVIALQDVSKVYATGSLSVRALDNISLQIDAGEYVAIMGPSGSGKSTLMHIIGCLDVLSEGNYRLAGDDVGEMDEIDLAQIRNRRIGFVFQQFNLLPSLSAWRNVELPMIYSGIARDVRRAKAVEALARVGLADRLDHRPGELSGGHQQRVAVARALVGDPDLILADEPTGNLDSTATNDALVLFDELHEQGRTIVLITHELDVAQRARRIVRVRDGVLTADSARPEVGRQLAGTGPRHAGVIA